MVRAACIVSLVLGSVAVQAAVQSPQDKLAALEQSLAQNQAALKAYTWTEAIEISLKGEVRQREEKQCRYTPDGTVEKNLVVGSAGSEGHIEDLKAYLEKAVALLQEYAPPD